jgi:HNH endonuclease
MPHHYTLEQKDFIKQNVKGITTDVLTDMINQQFCLNLKRTQIRAFMKNNGLKNGVKKQFKPGHTPANKGTKGLYKGGEATQFKKGNKPHTYLPVGTERVNGEGYVDIKIADPNKWRAKHVLIWEKENGPVPPGHAIIFGDGNRRNFEVDNLIRVTRRQLGMMNQKGLISNHADLTRTGVLVADLYGKISDRKKK